MAAEEHLPACPVTLNQPGPCVCPERIYDALAAAHAKEKRRQESSPQRKAKEAKRTRDFSFFIPRIAGAETRYDSVDHLPPIYLDSEYSAKKPPRVPQAIRKGEREFTLEERKVRFLLMFNYTGGNWTMACQDAGVPRAVADEWVREDPRIKPLMERALEEVADRLSLRLSQRVGLMPMPKGVSFHDAALFGLVKKFKPDIFGDPGGGDDERGVRSEQEHAPAPQKTGINIPRPSGPGPGDITGL